MTEKPPELPELRDAQYYRVDYLSNILQTLTFIKGSLEKRQSIKAETMESVHRSLKPFREYQEENGHQVEEVLALFTDEGLAQLYGFTAKVKAALEKESLSIEELERLIEEGQQRLKPILPPQFS